MIVIIEIILEFLLPLMLFALTIRRTAVRLVYKPGFRRENVRGKGRFLLGGNSQGRDSLNRPLAMVESFPFEKY
jgi:hypothetical protein